MRRRQAGKGAAYIKISESEIANDYPEPAQYEKVHSWTPHLSSKCACPKGSVHAQQESVLQRQGSKDSCLGALKACMFPSLLAAEFTRLTQLLKGDRVRMQEEFEASVIAFLCV